MNHPYTMAKSNPYEGEFTLASEEGLDSSGGEYVAICRRHGTLVNTKTIQAAVSAAADTREFCDGCRAAKAKASSVPLLRLPPYKLLEKNRDPPNRHRVIVERTISNRYGVGVRVTVSENWPHKQWWINASIQGMRMTNGLTTTNKAKADEWVKAVESGRVDVDRED